MFRLGYEIELATDREKETIKNALSNLGVDAWAENSPAEYPWYIHIDGSLMSLQKYHTREISSGVMDLEPGLDLLRKFFLNMVESNDETNGTCGFHVNLSFKNSDLNYRIDKLRLVLFLEENRVLDLFGRRGNSYCLSHRDTLKLYDSNNSVQRRFNKRLSQLSAEEIRLLINNEKFRTVNFGKLTCMQPYLEFRAIGGADYHKRYSEIHQTIKHFCDAMEYAIKNDEDELFRQRIAEIRNLNP
jgi:hypothetical protein